MSKKTKDLTIFIERNSLTFSGGMFEKVTKVTMNEKVVSDLEIIDKKKFIEILQSQVKKVESTINLILIFSDDSAFFKELPVDSTEEQLNLAEKDFLQLMPFDKTAHKLIKFTNSYQLVGINLNFRDVISEALSPLGYKLFMVIPAIVISNFDQKNGLTDIAVEQVVSKIDSLKLYNLIEASSENNEVLVSQVTTQKKVYMPILVGVFIVLICLLTILLIKG